MTPERFTTLFEETVKRCHELAVLKGGEYAPGADRLSNFKTNAESLGLSAEAIWAVYAGKHWDSIRTYVQDLVKGQDRQRSEPIEGRFHDLIVYAILGLALIEDRNGADKISWNGIPLGMGPPPDLPDNVKQVMKLRDEAIQELREGGFVVPIALLFGKDKP